MGLFDKFKEFIKGGLTPQGEELVSGVKEVITGGVQPSPTEQRETIRGRREEGKGFIEAGLTPEGEKLISGIREEFEAGKNIPLTAGLTPQGEFAARVIRGEATPEEIKAEAERFVKGVGIASTIIGGGLGLMRAGAGLGIRAGIPLAAKRGAIGKSSTFGINKLGSGFKLIATKFPTNTKAKTATTTWLIKLAGAFKNPVFVAGTLVGAIGSYPFAGFIKEEALQTLSFAVRTALNNEDVEGAERAIAEQEDVLNPGLWDKMIGAVPYLNIVKQLWDFYDAARTKLAIDKQMTNDMRIQQETGETDDEKWARVRQEQADQDKAAVDYYNEQRKLMVEWEREAERDARDEDARFWRQQAAKQMQMEAEDRQAIADFWIAYRKELQKLNEDSRPSNLNFGLL